MAEATVADKDKNAKLCTYAEKHGICSLLDGECSYLHGDICDLCGNAALHPYNTEKRNLHTQECLKQEERNIKLLTALKQSQGKTCGVCFEQILEKPTPEQRFGILPCCNHCFCLSCIRKWRQVKEFSSEIIKACPECRTISEFVCPSMYWVDSKEEKGLLCRDYLHALTQKKEEKFPIVVPPTRQFNLLHQLAVWDFMDEREVYWLHSVADDLENLVVYFSDLEDYDY